MATGFGPAMEGLSGGEGEEEGEEVRSKPVRERAMSCITKLLIQGMRGFGVKDEEKAVIEFGKPLTLITGQNGAGKTTIIECLKFITTGDYPPNSKSGAFVHDPKLTNERSSRGRVKLKFQDISGSTIICTRLLQTTQKARKMEQRAVDSSLEKVTPSGEKLKLTTRCADIEREMRDLLGVSKAILSNVIFCHQEESSWPLSEPKALKAKFDDIFASTRYTKALDNFKKIQQGMTEQIRIYKAELFHLTKQKAKVDEVKANLLEAQRRVEQSRAEISRINDELVPADNRLQELTNQYEEVSRIEKEIAMYESSKQQLLRSKTQLESRLENVFTGSKAELRHECEQHHGIVQRNNSELEECERQLKRLVMGVETMKERLDEYHKEQGRLKTEEQYHKDRVTSRDKSIVSTATQLSLPGYDKGPFQQDRVEDFLREFMQLRTQAKKKADGEKQELAGKEREVQSKLDQLRTNLAKIEESVQMKNNTIRKSRTDITAITREMTAIGTGAAALEGVEQELARAERELSEYHQQTNVDSMEAELGELGQEKQKQSTLLGQLQKELSQLSIHSSARGAVEELRKQRRVKEESYQLGLESVEPDLLAVMGVMPSLEQNLTRSLRDLARGKEREKQASSDRHRQAAAQLSRLQAQQEELQRQLQEKKDRVDALEQEVREVCGEGTVDSYQEMEQTLQLKIDSASENISTVKGSQSFFRKSLEKLHSNHKCPLCMRGFEDKTSLDSTIKTITTRLNEAIPRMIPRLNDELHQLQDQQKKLQQLKPKIDELTRIRAEELSKRQNALEEKTKAIAGVQKTVEAEKIKQNELQKELDDIRSLEPKVSQVSQLKEQLKELDEKVNSEEGRLRGLKSSSQRSQHVVSRELTAAQRKVEELAQKMDNKRQEITDCQRTERQMEGRVHELKEEKLQMQSRMQKRETLLSKKNDLTAQVETLDREVKVESNRVAPVREKLSELEEQKEALGRESRAKDAESWAELENLKVTYEGIQKNTNTINRYLRDGKDKAMEECNQKVQSLNDDIKIKDAEKRALEGRKADLTKQLANAKNRERELEDNLQLLSQREEIDQKSKRVNELKATLISMGLEQYDEEFQRLQTDVGRLRKDHARAEGHKLGQEDQVKHLQRELQSDLYATTEERYTNMVIDLKTTEAASKDLSKYYRALDRAITRFHSQKMMEINMIVKDLWIKTYKGGDIDRIEIRSDEGAQTMEESDVIKTKRMYTYRVVMVKGTTELDMRGRCSAGQKVLASIIIRLALAETFCLTSGLLTLDEPTTNLDRDNVEGLAQALTDIIKARSENQKNFQLIIITHDEAFVELLGHTGYTDCFYRVTKNIGETSRIRRFYF